MSDRYVYQNARIKSMESKLLTAQSVQRLLECTSLNDAFRTLTDMGFGLGATVAVGDFDGLFDAEEQKLSEFIREFNVDGALDAFLTLYDMLNLKLMLKQRFSDKPYTEIKTVGLYDIPTLALLIESEEPEKVIPEFAPAVKELKKLAAEGKLTPHKIDSTVDKAAYGVIFSRFRKRDALTREYFVRKLDLVNLCAFLRCKRLSLDEKFFKEGFIDGGSLASMKDMYDAPEEKLRDMVKGTPYESAFNRALDGGSIAAFETASDNLLLAYWKERKDDMFEVAPIVAYYLGKATEQKVAKLIVAGIKNGVETDVIRERLRDVYA